MGQGRQKSAGERVFTVAGDHLVWYHVRVLKLERVFLFMFSSMTWKDPKGFLKSHFNWLWSTMGTGGWGELPFFNHIFMIWDFAVLYHSFSSRV